MDMDFKLLGQEFQHQTLKNNTFHMVTMDLDRNSVDTLLKLHVDKYIEAYKCS